MTRLLAPLGIIVVLSVVTLGVDLCIFTRQCGLLPVLGQSSIISRVAFRRITMFSISPFVSGHVLGFDLLGDGSVDSFLVAFQPHPAIWRRHE